MTRKRKLTAEDLKFISENQKLSGFCGKITPEIANHQPDMDEIARSTPHLNAQQVPSMKLSNRTVERLRKDWWREQVREIRKRSKGPGSVPPS